MRNLVCLMLLLGTLGMMAFQQEPAKEKTEILAKNGTDPVCKMTVKKGTKLVSTHKDKQHGFCSKICKEQFDKNPEKFVKN